MPKEDYALVIEMVSTWGKKLSEAVEDAVRNGSFTAEELERIKHLKETNDRLSNNFENIFDDNQVYFYDDDLVASREDILIWAYISNLSNFISLFTICASKKEYNVNFSDDLLKKFSVLGGIKSGIIRSQKAEENWRAHALALAKKSRQMNKDGSLDFVASYISDHWGQKNKLVGHKRLTQVVSIWIKEGKLPPRSRA